MSQLVQCWICLRAKDTSKQRKDKSMYGCRQPCFQLRGSVIDVWLTLIGNGLTVQKVWHSLTAQKSSWKGQVLDVGHTCRTCQAIINIFILSMDQMTVCNLTTTHRELATNPTAPLRSTEHFCIIKLIVLVCWATTTTIILQMMYAKILCHPGHCQPRRVESATGLG